MKYADIIYSIELGANRRTFLKLATYLSGLLFLDSHIAFGALKPMDFPTKPLNHIVPSFYRERL